MTIIYRNKILLLIFLAVIIFYLPVLIHPEILLNRHNDLQEQFWPAFYFIKNQILGNHALPFWNNLWFSGLPLLPDPQFSLFYPPILFFILAPTGLGFILSFFFHTFLGSAGIYLSCRKAFNFSKFSSLFAALLYTFAPRLAGYLEAGHYGLAASFAWFPFLVMAGTMLLKKPTIGWSALLGVSLAGIFYTHTVTFLIAAVATVTMFTLTLPTVRSNAGSLNRLLFLILGLGIALGLSAVTLLPQISWAPSTTRLLLLQSRDMYPVWSGVKEIPRNILFPWSQGLAGMQSIDAEKWLSLGLLPTLIALLGFWKLPRRFKILTLILMAPVALLSLNNASPLYPWLKSQDWFVLMRVATRVWFIPVLLVTFLAGWGMENLLKSKLPKKYLFAITALSLAELLVISWTRLTVPTPAQSKPASQEIYQYLKSDSDRFRVFCVNRCLSQQESAMAGLELVEGYNTLQQKNYYQHMWQLSGAYWNYYTLALPPIAAYTFQKPHPDAESLGFYNTKYIISPYPLTDKNFELINKFGEYYIYQNLALRSRAYFRADGKTIDPEAKIITYTPNFIRVDTSEQFSSKLILSEVYSPGWAAYLNGQKKAEVLETPNSLRQVDLKPDTKFVDFAYQPEGFKIGLSITLATWLITGAVFFQRRHPGKKFHRKLNAQ